MSLSKIISQIEDRSEATRKLILNVVRLLENDKNKGQARQIRDACDEDYYPSEEEDLDTLSVESDDEDEDEYDDTITPEDETPTWNNLLQYTNRRGSEDLDRQVFLPNLARNNFLGINRSWWDAVKLDTVTKEELQMLNGYFFRPTRDRGGDAYGLKIQRDGSIVVYILSHKLGKEPFSLNHRTHNIVEGLQRAKKEMDEALRRTKLIKRNTTVQYHYHLICTARIWNTSQKWLQNRAVTIHDHDFFWNNALSDNLRQWLLNKTDIPQTMSWLLPKV